MSFSFIHLLFLFAAACHILPWIKRIQDTYTRSIFYGFHG